MRHADVDVAAACRVGGVNNAYTREVLLTHRLELARNGLLQRLFRLDERDNFVHSLRGLYFEVGCALQRRAHLQLELMGALVALNVNVAVARLAHSQRFRHVFERVQIDRVAKLLEHTRLRIDGEIVYARKQQLLLFSNHLKALRQRCVLCRLLSSERCHFLFLARHIKLA